MREPLSSLGKALATRRRYRIMDLARERRDVISMGRGDPDLPTPPHIVEAARRALDGWATHYTAAEGAPALREAIATKLQVDNGLDYPAGAVLVTGGAQEALFLALQCLLERGEEALITDPHYGAYSQMTLAAGADLVPVPALDGAMDPDVEGLRRAVSPRTKLLILVSPNNPSTNVISGAVLEALAKLARAHDLFVISDEIYEKLVFDGHQHRSIAALQGMQERTIVVNGFAKSYCMTGWRVGYAAGPVPVITAMARLKQAVSICAPAVGQAAALAALQGPQDSVAELLAAYTERRRVVLDALAGMALPHVPQQGTFYVYAEVGRSGLDSDAFAERLLQETGVLVFPSTEFGSGRRHIRLSLLQPVPVLQEAMERVARVWRSVHTEVAT